MQAAVLAWLAQYSSLQAYQEPVTVLLKEYLPGTHGVALNEVWDTSLHLMLGVFLSLVCRLRHQLGSSVHATIDVGGNWSLLLCCACAVQLYKPCGAPSEVAGAAAEVQAAQVRMMRALCTMPDFDRKWNAANRIDENEPPVVPLLGELPCDLHSADPRPRSCKASRVTASALQASGIQWTRHLRHEALPAQSVIAQGCQPAQRCCRLLCVCAEPSRTQDGRLLRRRLRGRLPGGAWGCLAGLQVGRSAAPGWVRR